MTDPELREALVLRLISLTGMKPDDNAMTLSWSPMREHSLWGALADEIIRQMLYTRLQDAQSAMSINEAVARMPLELAPPGWTP
jgi:hypothetical protein